MKTNTVGERNETFGRGPQVIQSREGLAELREQEHKTRLSLIELARCAAFFDLLRGISDEATARGMEPDEPALSTDALKRLQDATVSRSNLYAEKFNVSFPDETKRETMALAARDLLADMSANEENEFEDVSDSDVREVFENVEE